MSKIASLALGGNVNKRANFNSMVSGIPFAIPQVINRLVIIFFTFFFLSVAFSRMIYNWMGLSILVFGFLWHYEL